MAGLHGVVDRKNAINMQQFNNSEIIGVIQAIYVIYVDNKL